ncbi:serine/threonine protein kinase KIN1 KNAG_0H03140 [Huiozyma naganishii CBS 8797]|uniref:non-specific serine/threonine protein kinase n=1 Tax=Huiozyma naganishii (strain ATCC MYA-139 / BCRC 22969 / CBS 8797 / KCTC 17520 / NBRC 10181 / NCYC 3082 / Yp74L-3) TaxID=1071383 RepID=J7S8T3_HUIN7|nr:hypothetical protein KNAG_0H03140 [Kazachstania naganishii CBS 8797]CCK71729.1 hypothetical protein KNAG_0H03140 [Kazachstania naganishii CBS 8797]
MADVLQVESRAAGERSKSVDTRTNGNDSDSRGRGGSASENADAEAYTVMDSYCYECDTGKSRRKGGGRNRRGRSSGRGGKSKSRSRSRSKSKHRNEVDGEGEGDDATRQFYRMSLGDWDFQTTVGAGSMGKVKLARHRYDDTVCAVKIVNRATKTFLYRQQSAPAPQSKADIKERERLLAKEIARDTRTVREASLGQVLSHQNICQLYQMCTMSNHFYMMFEYVSGGQLLDYIIQHGSLREPLARSFARAIASGLAYLHANNVVHRDLKIENIMLTAAGEIKIIDFGLSNLFDPRAKLTTYCGSLYFAAPELLRAKPYIGPEIDIWSFGVILYVLVVGKVPFDDENSNALHEKIKRGKVSYPATLSIECISLLTKMLTVNPKRRATLKEIVTHHWMVRGYGNIPAKSFQPWRRCLVPEELDNTVFNEMFNLEFVADVDEARKQLAKLITSPEYIHLSTQHDTLDASYKDGSLDPAFDDPLAAFHPLVSTYWLTREFLERKRFGHHTPTLQFNEDKLATRSVPAIAEPARASLELNRETSNVTTDTEHTRGLLPPKVAKAGMAAHLSPTRKNHYNPSDAAPNTRTETSPLKEIHERMKIGNLFRRFSLKSPPRQLPQDQQKKDYQDHRRVKTETAQSIKFTELPEPPMRRKSVLNKPECNEDDTAARVKNPVHRKTRTTSVGGQRRPSWNFIRSDETPSAENLCDSNGFFESPETATTAGQEEPLDDQLTDAQIIQLAKSAPMGTMPSIDYPKVLFLKGFFSVQTTSSKPLPIVRYKVIVLLQRMGITFHEVKGGFVCLYEAPPIYKDFGNLENNALTPNRSRQSAATKSVCSSTSSESDELNSDTEEGENDGRGRYVKASDESLSPNTSAMGAQTMVSNNTVRNTANTFDKLSVKFEIHIVKVKIVGLAGVYFKKISGNTWVYKEVASKFLEELKL